MYWLTMLVCMHLDPAKSIWSLTEHRCTTRSPSHLRTANNAPTLEPNVGRQRNRHPNPNLNLHPTPPLLHQPAPPLHNKRDINPLRNLQPLPTNQQIPCKRLTESRVQCPGIQEQQDGTEYADAGMVSGVEGRWREGLVC